MLQKNNTWRLLSLFLDNPLKKFRLRQLSRITSLSTTAIKRGLHELIKEKLILELVDDLYPYYVGAFNSTYFREYKKIHTLEKIYSSKIIDYLDERLQPQAILLFGSCAKGEDTSTSDIDICVIGKEKKLSLGSFEKTLQRKIEFHYTQDFKKFPKELRNNIVQGVVLYGFIDVF